MRAQQKDEHETSPTMGALIALSTIIVVFNTNSSSDSKFWRNIWSYSYYLQVQNNEFKMLIVKCMSMLYIYIYTSPTASCPGVNGHLAMVWATARETILVGGIQKVKVYIIIIVLGLSGAWLWTSLKWPHKNYWKDEVASDWHTIIKGWGNFEIPFSGNLTDRQ